MHKMLGMLLACLIGGLAWAALDDAFTQAKECQSAKATIKILTIERNAERRARIIEPGAE